MYDNNADKDESNGENWETVARNLLRDRLLQYNQELHTSLKKLDSHIANDGEITVDALADVRFDYLNVVELIERDLASLLDEPDQFETVLHVIPDETVAQHLENRGYEVRKK